MPALDDDRKSWWQAQWKLVLDCLVVCLYSSRHHDGTRWTWSWGIDIDDIPHIQREYVACPEWRKLQKWWQRPVTKQNHAWGYPGRLGVASPLIEQWWNDNGARNQNILGLSRGPWYQLIAQDDFNIPMCPMFLRQRHQQQTAIANNSPSQRRAHLCVVDGRDPTWQIRDIDDRKSCIHS